MIQFDARTVQPSLVLQPVPESWYKVAIRKSNMKATSKGDGGYLELICEILEGQFQGRQLYWNLNLFNPSQQAVEIAYKTLSAIAHVTGQFQINDQNVPDNVTPMLHNIPFYVFVVVSQGTQGPINNIRGCKDINGNDPGKSGQGTPMPQTQPAPAWQSAGTGPGPAPAWQATTGAPGAAGTAPAGFPGQPAAAPMAPGGAAWQAGSNTPPAPGPTWTPNPPQGNPNPAPNQWTTTPAQPQSTTQWSGGAPTQQQQNQPAPANTGWHQNAPPANAPWQR